MPAMNPGFLRLQRDDGRFVIVRVDEITHILENQVKDKDSGEMVDCLTVQLRNNLAVHVRRTLEEFWQKMSEAAGGSKLVLIEAA